MADDELRVRQLAYRIWESEGRPEGQQQRHWDMALKIVAAERASGHEASVDEVGEPHDETPIFEDDLPLEEDETGIQENRLPLEDPEQPAFDEAPFRDDIEAGQDTPVHDRGNPEQQPASSGAGSMEPMPEGSATAERTEHPRSVEDSVTEPDATDTSQVPGKTATRARKTAAKSGPGKGAAKKAPAKSTATKKSAAGKTASKTAEKGETARKTSRGTTPKPKG